jgi:hypothetical protein
MSDQIDLETLIKAELERQKRLEAENRKAFEQGQPLRPIIRIRKKPIT